MRTETLLKSIALLTVQIECIEELEKDKILYKYNLKNQCIKLKQILAQTLTDFYKNFPDQLQVEAYKDINAIESAINKVKIKSIKTDVKR
jgi:hypothetical protein